MLTRQKIQLVTTEAIREDHERDFIHALTIINEKNEAIVGWYNAPTTSTKYFDQVQKRTMLGYHVRCLACDPDARHELWCTAHDDLHSGTQLINKVYKLRGVQLHQPDGHTFKAINNKATAEKQKRTIDLILRRTETISIRRIVSYAAVGSDNLRVYFEVKLKEQSIVKPRGITKNKLQSYALKETAKIYYTVALNKVEKT